MLKASQEGPETVLENSVLIVHTDGGGAQAFANGLESKAWSLLLNNPPAILTGFKVKEIPTEGCMEPTPNMCIHILPPLL